MSVTERRLTRAEVQEKMALVQPQGDAPLRLPVNYGDREIATSNEILRTVVGSGLHGISVGTDDHDEMGIFVPPPEYVLGLQRQWPDGHSSDQYVSRTQPEGVRSGVGDTDLTIYSLQKYLRLAAGGNPTVLLPLFASGDKVLVSSPLGEHLRANATMFASRKAIRKFLGYLNDQYVRLTGGGRQSRVPNRPEVVEQHGFDTKYAAHALRLAYQGIEFARTGRITLPMPQDEREHVLAVRQGHFTFEVTLRLIQEQEKALDTIYVNDESPHPEEPDWARINEFSIYAHQQHWMEQADGRLSPG